jgi:hypothetical protein
MLQYQNWHSRIENLSYCNGFDQRVARQQLLNTIQHTTVEDAVFPMSSAPRPVLLTDQSTRSLTCDTCFLCGLRHATI